MRKAISTTAVAAIIIVVVIVAAVGVYAAIGTGKTTITSTVTSTETTVSTLTTTVTSGSVSTTSVTSTTSGVVLPSTLPSLSISETGSSLLYPLFNLWVPNFTAMYPTVKLNTASTGSGTGQSQAEAGTVQIGASDAYLTDAQQAANPNILNIPLSISAQMINYNVPEIPSTMHLNFTGAVLSGIYNGTITYWDSQYIKAINPAAASLLPHQVIIPIHRSDGSGDTFLFTQFLSKTSPSWSAKVGFGTAVSWPPVPSSQSALGNGGMVQSSKANKYSIAYIGVSYFESTITHGLNYAFLQNQAGNFVNFTQANIQAAANELVSSTPQSERISLIYAPGANSYPIINYEYAMVLKVQNQTGMALGLKTLLTWAILPQYGNSPQFLNQVNFVALPPSVVQLSLTQINEITGP